MSEDTRKLSDDEIDALSAMESDDDAYPNDIAPELSELKVHNLANEDRTIGINISAIDMITERFTRHLRLGLLEVLRTNPKIHVADVKTVVFDDYLKDLKPPLSVNTIKISGLRGSSLVVIDPNVIFSALDNFFGGFGSGIEGLPAGRMFTPTETRIINIMMEVVFASLKEAWSPIMPVNIEYVSAEINPQFVQIADENDLVVVCHLDVELDGDKRGRIDIIYPFSALKPLRDRLRGRVQDTNEADKEDHVWSEGLENAASHVELEAVVQLGQVALPLSRFQSLQPGDILWFKKDEYAHMIIEGNPVMLGDVGVFKGQAAIQIHGSMPLESKTNLMRQQEIASD
jgi:flagellar motor switch protein FliM